jgi:hypothetical protein
MPRLLGEDDKVKLGVEFTVRVIVVVFVRLPEMPVMVTGTVPAVAVPLTVSVSVLVFVAGFGPNDAVTPLGKPAADKLTWLVKPFCAFTVIVLAPLPPCEMLRLLGDADKLKLGGGAAVTVNVTGLLLFIVGATKTVSGPEVAPEAMVAVMDVPLQELMVIGVPFSSTKLAPCVAPNPLPEMTT